MIATSPETKEIHVNAAKSEEITFPYVHKDGSVSVKIYRTPTHGCDAYTLAYYMNGVRKRPTFPTFEQALEEAKIVARKLGSSNIDVLELKSADRASYLRSREILDPLGISLEIAAAHVAHAVKLLGDTPIATAIEFFVKRHQVKLELRTVRQTVDELLIAKEADKLSSRYLQCLRWSLGKFAAKFKGHIGSVSGREIDTWLRDTGLSPRSRNNLRNDIQTLFKFAIARGYLPKDHDEISAVTMMKDRDGDIEVFSPEELVEILNCANADFKHLIPFLALGAFAGIRHAEIQRLEWKDIDFDEGFIEVRASKAKTASRRTVPLMANLKAWLLPNRQATGLICSHQNMAFEIHLLCRKINQLRKEKNQPQEFKWKHNGMRHSFISYRVAEVQNVNQVALEAGNSPQMIFRHHRELVRPKEASRWFSIQPGKRGKIA